MSAEIYNNKYPSLPPHSTPTPLSEISILFASINPDTGFQDRHFIPSWIMTTYRTLQDAAS